MSDERTIAKHCAFAGLIFCVGLIVLTAPEPYGPSPHAVVSAEHFVND